MDMAADGGPGRRQLGSSTELPSRKPKGQLGFCFLLIPFLLSGEIGEFHSQ